MEYNTKIVQRHCLVILEEIIRICDLYKIDYFLVGGSALGAFRHKGFIPWDDDIDIGIPRPHYEKFLKICSKELKKEFYLQDYSIQKKLVFPFAKVRLNDTAFVERPFAKIDMHHGIFIDVFPLDYSPENFLLKKFQIWGIRTCSALRSAKLDLAQTASKRILAKLLKRIVPNNMLPLGYNFFTKIGCKFKSFELVNCLGAYSYEKECMPEEVFGGGILMDFEHLKCRVPYKIENYLISLYGENFRELPPIEKRQTHNPEWVSFNEEYKYKKVKKG